MIRFAAFGSFLMLFPSFSRLGSCFGPMRTLRSDHFNHPQASRSSRIDGFWWILVDLRVDLLVEPPSKDHSSPSISQYEPKMSRNQSIWQVLVVLEAYLYRFVSRSCLFLLLVLFLPLFLLSRLFPPYFLVNPLFSPPEMSQKPNLNHSIGAISIKWWFRGTHTDTLPYPHTHMMYTGASTGIQGASTGAEGGLWEGTCFLEDFDPTFFGGLWLTPRCLDSGISLQIEKRDLSKHEFSDISWWILKILTLFWCFLISPFCPFLCLFVSFLSLFLLFDSFSFFCVFLFFFSSSCSCFPWISSWFVLALSISF